MNCPELLRTQAFLDGELTGDATRQAEHHIESCEECRAFSASVAEMSDLIHAQASRYSVPQSMRRSLDAAITSENASRASNIVPYVKRRSFWTGAVSGVAASALAAAVAIFAVLPPSAETLAQSVEEAHVNALMSGKLIQVVSSSHHTVKPWFAGKVDVSPPVTDFTQQGFPLIGGRVDRIAGARAAVVAYTHGRHEIDLFVWADKSTALPGESTRHGYHTLFWKNGDMNFAAVCDMEGPELQKFANLVRSEAE